MIPKIIFFAIILAITGTLVQGLPRTLRFKPVVNLNPEKLNTTEKPIEVRKSTLFPKNNKKYVVTDNPLPRMTAPSSYKYYLAKRPLLLKFEPSSPLWKKDQPVPHQSLMKKVKFVVSTPSPADKITKVNYWENQRPIHIRNNKTNAVNNMMPQKKYENKDIQLNNTTTTESIPEKEKLENILLPVNQEELKSNPNAIADEINDIIAFVNKLHETKENGTNTRNTSQHPIAMETLITANTANSPATEKITTTLSPLQKNANAESSLKGNKTVKNVTSTPEIVFIPVNLNDLRSHPNLIAEEVNNVIHDIKKHDSSVTDSKTSTVAITTRSTTMTSTSMPEIIKAAKGEDFTTSKNNSEPSQYPNDDIENVIYHIPNNSLNHSYTDDVTTKRSTYPAVEPIINSSTDILYIPVKLEELKSHPYLMPKEVNDFIDDINKHPTKLDITTTPTTITAEVVTDVSSTSPATISSSTKAATPWMAITTSEDMKSQPHINENELNKILDSKNKKKIESTVTLSPKAEEQTTSIKELVIREDKSLTNTIKPLSNTSDFNTPAESSERQILPEIIFIPINLNDFKSNSQGAIDEVQEKVNNLDKSHSNSEKNLTDKNLTSKEKYQATETSTNPIQLHDETIQSSSNEKTTENSLPTTDITPQADVNASKISSKESSETSEYSQTSQNHITEESPEVVFIPVNVHDLESNPVIADEVKDIVNYMNKLHPHYNVTEAPVLEINTTPESFSATSTDKVTENISSVKPLVILSTSSTTEISAGFKNLESDATTDSSVNSTIDANPSASTENYLTTESTPREIVFIPVKLEELKNNPDLVADEVKDIVDNMNEQDKTYNNKTEQYTPSMKPTTENPAGTTTSVLPTNYAYPSTSTENYLTTESTPREIVFIPVKLEELQNNPDLVADEVKDIVNNMNEQDRTYNNKTTQFTPSMTPTSENPAGTTTSVNSTNDTNPSTSTENYLTTQSSPREFVFIPVKLEELKNNPDAVADEVKDIVNYMNEKDKTYNNKTEQYTQSIITTTESPAGTTTLKTSKSTTENVVTPKYIIIEPIEVTALKDEDDNDIYVGNIINKLKYANNQNDREITTAATKGGKSNSISDDISDVIYVMQKNSKNK